MPVWVRDAGAWKPVTKLWVRDATQWKAISVASVRDASSWKSASSFSPNPPTGLAAGAGQATQYTSFQLTWTAPSSGPRVATYTVRRYTWNADRTVRTLSETVTGIVGTTHTFNNLSQMTYYSFEVISVGITGLESPASAEFKWRTGQPQGTMSQVVYGWLSTIYNSLLNVGWSGSVDIAGMTASQDAEPGRPVYAALDGAADSWWQASIERGSAIGDTFGSFRYFYADSAYAAYFRVVRNDGFPIRITDIDLVYFTYAQQSNAGADLRDGATLARLMKIDSGGNLSLYRGDTPTLPGTTAQDPTKFEQWNRNYWPTIRWNNLDIQINAGDNNSGFAFGWFTTRIPYVPVFGTPYHAPTVSAVWANYQLWGQTGTTTVNDPSKPQTNSATW